MPEQKNEAAEMLLQLMQTNFLIMFEALYRKGALDYPDIQEAIGKVRESFRLDQYTPAIREHLNIMERLYQPGHYNSQWSPPDAPKP